MPDLRPKILMRVFKPRGRIQTGETRFGGLSRMHRRRGKVGLTATSQNPSVPWASPNQVRAHVNSTVGAWDDSGVQGRAELNEIYRRAGQ